MQGNMCNSILYQLTMHLCTLGGICTLKVHVQIAICKRFGREPHIVIAWRSNEVLIDVTLTTEVKMNECCGIYTQVWIWKENGSTHKLSWAKTLRSFMMTACNYVNKIVKSKKRLTVFVVQLKNKEDTVLVKSTNLNLFIEIKNVISNKHSRVNSIMDQIYDYQW